VRTKIYALRDKTRYLRYVGKTMQTLGARLSSHLKEAINGGYNHRCNWVRSMMRHGFLPSITLIEEVDGDGSKEEIRWIKYFKDHGVELVNGTDGGEGCAGRILSPMSRAKLSRSLKGRVISDVWRKNLSKAHKGQRPYMKGRHHTEETRKKISSSSIDKPKSEEFKRRVSLTMKGVPKSPEMRRKLSLSCIGKHHTEETKRKIGIAGRGRKHTIETRTRISQTVKQQWAERKLRNEQCKV